jgi:hypothetical protein
MRGEPQSRYLHWKRLGLYQMVNLGVVSVGAVPHTASDEVPSNHLDALQK